MVTKQKRYSGQRDQAPELKRFCFHKFRDHHTGENVADGIEDCRQRIYQSADDDDCGNHIGRDFVNLNHQHFADITAIRDSAGDGTYENGDSECHYEVHRFEKIPAEQLKCNIDLYD